MDNLVISFFLSTLWISIGCGVLRLNWNVPYNFLCVIWLTLVFTSTLAMMAVTSLFLWPTSIWISVLLVPCAIIFYLFNFHKNIDINSEEPVWGKYIYGGILLSISIFIAFQNAFFTALMRITVSNSVSLFVVALYYFAVLFVGISGVLVIISKEK